MSKSDQQLKIRTHEVEAVVEQNRNWNNAIKSVIGSDAFKDRSIWRVDELYKPRSVNKERIKFTLVNFPSGDGNWDTALKLAKKERWAITNPRECFAVVEQHDLRSRLSIDNYICVVSTDSCLCFNPGARKAIPQTCHINLRVDRQDADFSWIGLFSSQYDWFLFKIQ